MKLSDVLFILALAALAPGAIFFMYGLVFLALALVGAGMTFKAAKH